MTEQQVIPSGHFSWVELATTDGEAAKTFYTQLFGWSFRDDPVGPGGVYTMLFLNDKSVGALYQMGAERQDPPCWSSYVSVDSADETVARIKELGGQVMTEPFDVMEAGRMAVFTDPSGAALCIWQAKAHQGMGTKGEPGSPCWFELMTRDTRAAGSFYSQLFGWGIQHEQEPMPYTMYKVGETEVAGMMDMPAELPAEVPPHWLIYFTVADCDAAAAKAKELGGSVEMPPMDIPEVGRMAVLSDPQGGVFAVFTDTKK